MWREQEVTSKGTTRSKDPSTKSEMNLHAATQGLLLKPFVDRDNDNLSVEQRVLTVYSEITQ